MKTMSIFFSATPLMTAYVSAVASGMFKECVNVDSFSRHYSGDGIQASFDLAMIDPSLVDAVNRTPHMNGERSTPMGKRDPGETKWVDAHYILNQLIEMWLCEVAPTVYRMSRGELERAAIVYKDQFGNKVNYATCVDRWACRDTSFQGMEDRDNAWSDAKLSRFDDRTVYPRFVTIFFMPAADTNKLRELA